MSRDLLFSLLILRDIACIYDMVFMCSYITGHPPCDDMINHFLHIEQLLNSYICENDGWKRKVGAKKVSLYTGQCGNKDWCVGYWFPARILWVIQSRQELIEIILLKRIQNVLVLRWADNSGLINKALLLNKTVKDTRLSTYCVPSQFKLTTERTHKQTNKQSLGTRPNRLLS